jgi:hypothetical protein
MKADYRNSPTLRRIAERKQDEIDRYGPIYWHFMHERGTQYIEFPNTRSNQYDDRNDYNRLSCPDYYRSLQNARIGLISQPHYQSDTPPPPDAKIQGTVSRPPSFLSRLVSGLRSLLGLRE